MDLGSNSPKMTCKVVSKIRTTTAATECAATSCRPPKETKSGTQVGSELRLAVEADDEA